MLEYKQNCTRSKSLCMQMEYLTSEIKSNKKMVHLFQLEHNEKELARIVKELDFIWDEQIEMSGIIQGLKI